MNIPQHRGLEGTISNCDCGFGRANLRGCGGHLVGEPISISNRRAVNEHASAFEAHVHVGEHPFNALEIRDAFAKLLAFIGVDSGEVEGALSDTERLQPRQYAANCSSALICGIRRPA